MTVKRILDVIGAAAALILCAPLLLAVALLIRATMGSPVFFRQMRPGLRGEPFELIKFRTMRNPEPGEECLTNDGMRLTRLGRTLRTTSLDELPELWNVLVGHMSLVGPRPLLMQYLDRYTPEQARRHEVRPGLTGLTQVKGRNALRWEDKFALDVHYIDNRSLLLDLKIIGLTIKQVVRRTGIAADGDATMPEFMGSSACEPGEGAALSSPGEED